jgi:predicted dehydrogenase
MSRKNINTNGVFTRRHFIKSTAALGTLAWLTPTSRVFGANNRFRVAICGIRGQGNSHLRSFAGQNDVEIAWLVDPDSRLLDQRAAETLQRTGRRPKTTADLRRVLDDPDVDAIVVATPNHWHALMVIWAAQAGKHCFVEKPSNHSFYEGRVALEAANKYGVVIQHGTQRRSQQNKADLVRAIHSGKFGKLAVVHGCSSKSRNSIGHQPISEPPAWLDWDLWRGPAPIKEYHGNYAHYNWHWFWKTGNGDVNNLGTHHLDLARWALDPEMHFEHPVKVASLGNRFMWDDQAETPNSVFSVAEYSNGQKLIHSVRNIPHDGYADEVECRYYFEDGGMLIGPGRADRNIVTGQGKTVTVARNEQVYISPEGEVSPAEGDRAEITPGGHQGSFIQACREGKPELANATMADGFYTSTLGNLLEISYRIGEELPFNAKAGRFGDNSAVASEFLRFHEILRDRVGMPEDKEKYIVGPMIEFDGANERFVGDHAEEANPLLRPPRRTGFELPDIGRV